MLLWTLGLTLCLPALAGCSDDTPTAAPAPSGGGAGTTARPSGQRTGRDDDAGSEDQDDAGSDPGIVPLTNECVSVDDVGFMGEDMPGVQRVNAVSSPTDMELGRVLTTWDASCTDPAVGCR